ncbi:hypothetical protein [Azohydromonas aeria]|uniref:hypothetical protein n=1 Tax=Azohydromonas aeria TaxID=2590212 RepID=UPI0012F764D7|nr:hypothetical protein [Azohydromonas aeria]
METRFFIAGEFFTLAQMLEVNSDAEMVCEWLKSAKPGDVMTGLHEEEVRCVAAAPQDMTARVLHLANGAHVEYESPVFTCGAAVHEGMTPALSLMLSARELRHRAAMMLKSATRMEQAAQLV